MFAFFLCVFGGRKVHFQSLFSDNIFRGVTATEIAVSEHYK